MYPSRFKAGQSSARHSIRNTTLSPKVKRWDGLSRTSTAWDGLRRDLELWLPHGDCWVHLYAKGQSKRGPTFCVPIDDLNDAHFGGLFSLLHAQTKVDRSNTAKWELYMPAPESLSREEAFAYHLTTRNIFAFIYGKPLVGVSLGKTLVDLHQRMMEYRDEMVDNIAELAGYCETMGYLDFGHCPDYALAALYYAEQTENREMWIDAFAHCVGMNKELVLSEEYEIVSDLSKALMVKSYLEMEVHLDHVVKATGTFLEDELSGAQVGMSQGARDHLDRFRSFLHAFYLQRHGYWPPAKDFEFNKELYTRMYFEFQALYDYLVDTESTEENYSMKPGSGGLCVIQNVKAFDRRQGYQHLPQLMPLLPQKPKQAVPTKRRTLAPFRLNNPEARAAESLANWHAVVGATNSSSLDGMKTPLVRAYMRFEKECCYRVDENVSLADARKVRWLLVYGTLQMLIYAVRAPPEVRSTESISYPLCCTALPTLPWETKPKARSKASSLMNQSIVSTSATSNLSVPHRIDEIRPDCDDGFYELNAAGSTLSNTPSQGSDESYSPISKPRPEAPSRSSSFVKDGTVRQMRRLSKGPFRSSSRSETPRPGKHAHFEPEMSDKAADIEAQPTAPTLLAPPVLTSTAPDLSLDTSSVQSSAASNGSRAPSPVFSTLSNASQSTMASPASSTVRRDSHSSAHDAEKTVLSPVPQSPVYEDARSEPVVVETAQNNSTGDVVESQEQTQLATVESGSSNGSFETAEEVTPKAEVFSTNEVAPKASESVTSEPILRQGESNEITTTEDIDTQAKTLEVTKEAEPEATESPRVSLALDDIQRDALRKLNIKPSGLFNIKVPFGPSEFPLTPTTPSTPFFQTEAEQSEATVPPPSSRIEPLSTAASETSPTHAEKQPTPSTSSILPAIPKLEPLSFAAPQEDNRPATPPVPARRSPPQEFHEPPTAPEPQSPQPEYPKTPPVPERRRPVPSTTTEERPDLPKQNLESYFAPKMNRDQRRLAQIAHYQAWTSRGKPEGEPELQHAASKSSLRSLPVISEPTQPTEAPQLSQRSDHSPPPSAQEPSPQTPPQVVSLYRQLKARRSDSKLAAAANASETKYVGPTRYNPSQFTNRNSTASSRRSSIISATSSFSNKASSFGRAKGASLTKDMDTLRKRFKIGA